MTSRLLLSEHSFYKLIISITDPVLALVHATILVPAHRVPIARVLQIMYVVSATAHVIPNVRLLFHIPHAFFSQQ
jgi:hypothetical protein